MASVVHFHFRNTKAQDMVKFEGDHISLQDLKLLIAKKRGLEKAAEIDFAVTNSETAEGAATPPSPARAHTHARAAPPTEPSITASPAILPRRLRPRRAGAVGGRALVGSSDRVHARAEYTDPAMFIPKDTRVEVRKVNVKAQAQGLKDAPEKASL